MKSVGPVAPSRPATRWPKSLSSQTPGAMPEASMKVRPSCEIVRSILPPHFGLANVPWKRRGRLSVAGVGGRPPRAVVPVFATWAALAIAAPRTRIARAALSLLSPAASQKLPTTGGRSPSGRPCLAGKPYSLHSCRSGRRCNTDFRNTCSPSGTEPTPTALMGGLVVARGPAAFERFRKQAAPARPG